MVERGGGIGGSPHPTTPPYLRSPGAGSVAAPGREGGPPGFGRPGGKGDRRSRGCGGGAGWETGCFGCRRIPGSGRPVTGRITQGSAGRTPTPPRVLEVGGSGRKMDGGAPACEGDAAGSSPAASNAKRRRPRRRRGGGGRNF